MPLGCAVELRDFVGAGGVDLAQIGEEQDRVQRAGDEEVFQFVLVAGGHADQPLAAARLPPVGADGRALDVAAPGDGDEDVLVGDQVFDVEVGVHAGDDLRPPRVTVLFL